MRCPAHLSDLLVRKLDQPLVEEDRLYLPDPGPVDLDVLLACKALRGSFGLADEAIREVAGTSHRLPSGPLHDAAEVSRAGIPTVMLFVQSLRGLSHTKLEDTKKEHLELSVLALDRLTSKTLAWLS